jgi:hypothetical protein
MRARGVLLVEAMAAALLPAALSVSCRTEPSFARACLELTTERCGDGAFTSDTTPILILDVALLPVRLSYGVELVDRVGALRADAVATRIQRDRALFAVPVRLERGVYFVRVLEDRQPVREFRFTVIPAGASEPRKTGTCATGRHSFPASASDAGLCGG